MYVVYCQNKPKSEHIVSEYIESFFEVSLASQSCPFLIALIDLASVLAGSALPPSPATREPKQQQP